MLEILKKVHTYDQRPMIYDEIDDELDYEAVNSTVTVLIAYNPHRGI